MVPDCGGGSGKNGDGFSGGVSDCGGGGVH